MAVRVYFPADNKISIRLYKANYQLKRKMLSYTKRKSKELVEYMKDNHPWQNRTTKAEQGLKGEVTVSPKGYQTNIKLSHSVPYGVYLEYWFERRFAIIEPTIRIMGPTIMNETSQLYTDVMIGP